MRPNRRTWIAAAAVATLLLLAAALALQLGARRLEAALRDALGPQASVDSVALAWDGVEVRGLRIRASTRGWPAADELRAARVHLRPDLASLWSSGWRIARVRLDGGYVAVQRTRQGRLRVVPALLEKGAAGPGGAAAPGPALRIARIELRDTVVDFHDTTLRGGDHRIRLDALQADVGPVDLPALAEPMQIALQARLKGVQRDGTLAIDGTLTPATRDADLRASARGVDLVALQPYLLKASEGGVRRGTLDLTLSARVQAQQLRAPGTLTLTGLELAAGGGVLSTFAGVPRQAVLAAMERNGRIEVAFTLEGRLDDPEFSLNERFATRLATSLAETLGVSLRGAVEGVGSVLKGLLGR